MTTAAKIVGALAIGLALSVVVAWLCAALVEQPGMSERAPFAEATGASEPPEEFSAARTAYPVQGVTTLRVAQRRGVRRSLWYFEPDDVFDPSVRVRYASIAVDEYAAGWPMPALAWSDLPNQRGSVARSLGAWRAGIEYRTGRAYPASLENWRRLPIRPVDSGVGLLVNTLVWSVAGVGLIAIAGGLRRRRRRRRGLCVACAYPVRDEAGSGLAVCPECGSAAA